MMVEALKMQWLTALKVWKVQAYYKPMKSQSNCTDVVEIACSQTTSCWQLIQFSHCV